MRPADAPDEWTVVVNETRGDRWDGFDGGVVAFLVAVFVDGHRVSVFSGIPLSPVGGRSYRRSAMMR
jgi:hypothetical protein